MNKKIVFQRIQKLNANDLTDTVPSKYIAIARLINLYGLYTHTWIPEEKTERRNPPEQTKQQLMEVAAEAWKGMSKEETTIW